MPEHIPHPPPALHEALELHASTGFVLAEDMSEGLTIRSANAAFAAFHGTTPEALAGRPLLGLSTPEPTAAERETIRAALAAGRSALVELPLDRPGGRRWLELDVAPVRGTATFVIVARDVTEQRAARDELARTETLLRMATQAGGVGIWEWDVATGAVTWNATLRRLIGVGPDEPPSVEAWLARVHPDDVELARTPIEQRYRHGEGRYRIVRADDGRVRHVVVRAQPIGAGDPLRLVGMVVDVTEAQEAAGRVQETLESISDAYFALDRGFRFVAVNRNAERLMRVPRRELLGQHVQAVFPEASGTDFERGFTEAMHELRPVEFETYFEPLGGWFEVRAYPIPDGIAVYFRNIDDRRAAEAERERLLRLEQQARQAAEAAQTALRHQAAHDALTDLANRVQLRAHLDAALQRGTGVHVLYIDLDRFKLVNDSLGHAAGDALLQTVAARLTALVRREDVVARLGGDEFVIGLVDSEAEASQAIADRVLEAVRVPVEVDGQTLITTASIGIASSRGAGDADTLLRDADVALYRAKDAGRDQAVWFDERARSAVLRRVAIERDLRAALSAGDLRLAYQPTFDLATGRMTGVEALLRWRHPDHGAVPPADFVPVAEESGLIVSIGDWVLSCVARQAAAWADGAPFVAWANVSARQLARPGLADAIERHLGETGLRPDQLGIEMTEAALAERVTALGELSRICALGVHVAIDDFGSGSTAIGRLRDLPVDVLKIDRSFVAAMDAPTGVKTVAAIVDLGHALERTVIAEGVETTAQLDALRAMGCDAVAGYLLAHPVPAADVGDAAGRGTAVLTGG